MCTYICIYAVFFSEVVDYTNVAVSVYKRRAESLKQTFYGRKDEEFVKKKFRLGKSKERDL